MATQKPQPATREKENEDDIYLQQALEEAKVGLNEGGIPIGAVLVHEGTDGVRHVLGMGHNQRVQKKSPVLHGEMDCLENAGRCPASVYRKCTMYTTLSPCSMCSGAILLFGIPRVVVGENQTFLGAEEHLRANGVEVIVAQDASCVAIMKEFVREHKVLWEEDIGEPSE